PDLADPAPVPVVDAREQLHPRLARRIEADRRETVAVGWCDRGTLGDELFLDIGRREVRDELCLRRWHGGGEPGTGQQRGDGPQQCAGHADARARGTDAVRHRPAAVNSLRTCSTCRHTPANPWYSSRWRR